MTSRSPIFITWTAGVALAVVTTVSAIHTPASATATSLPVHAARNVSIGLTFDASTAAGQAVKLDDDRVQALVHHRDPPVSAQLAPTTEGADPLVHHRDPPANARMAMKLESVDALVHHRDPPVNI